jgi:hypothetical protein
MLEERRLLILTAAEIDELYSVPSFSKADQRFFFNLSDRALLEINRIRDRKHRIAAIALLGYFRSKPILLNPSFKSMQADLLFIADRYFHGMRFRRFSLKADQKSRIYDRILSILEVETWNDRNHQRELAVLPNFSSAQVNSCITIGGASELSTSDSLQVQRFSDRCALRL